MAILYVVRRRVEWEYSWDAIPKADEQYVATLPTRAAADEYMRRIDRDTKRSMPMAEYNPFHTTRYEELTSFPPHVLRDFLRDADIEPPPPPGPVERKEYAAHAEGWAWSEWWEKAAEADDLTESQRLRVWDGLNLHRLYEVEEVEAGQKMPPDAGTVVYAVVHRHWEYDDCHYCGANEAVAAFRTRERAEAEVLRLAGERSADPESRNWNGGPNEYVVVEMLLESEG